MLLPQAEFVARIIPDLRKRYPGISDSQVEGLANAMFQSPLFCHGSTFGAAATSYCDPESTLNDYLIPDVAAQHPELTTPPPTAHEALALLAGDDMRVEDRMSTFRELNSLSPDERLARVNAAALHELRQKATEKPPAPTQQPARASAAAVNWGDLSEAEQFRRASRFCSKHEHELLASDLARTAQAYAPSTLQARDDAHVAILRTRPVDHLSPADRMTLYRASHPEPTK